MDPNSSPIQITYREELKRKGVHLSSLWMPIAILLIRDQWISAGIFALLLVITVLFEHAYACNWPVMSTMYGAIFKKMLRKPPAPGAWVVSGASYVLVAALLVVVLYETTCAAGAMVSMLVGDAMAALIGRRFGRHKAPNGKSWEGCVAFVISSAVGLTILFAIVEAPANCWIGYLALLPAATAELFEKQLHVDDNFSIPLIVGLGFQLGVILEAIGHLA